MPNLTTNLELKKPLLDEAADIGVINENMDALDETIGTINTTLASMETTLAAVRYPLVSQASGTATIDPFVLNDFGAAAAITVTLAAPTAGIASEYMLCFASGETATTLSLPATVTWLGGKAMKIKASKRYVVSILYDGVNYSALGGEW